MLWSRNRRTAELLGELGNASQQFGSIRDDFRLWRRPRANLGFARSRREVVVAFCITDTCNRAAHANLTMQIEPGKGCGANTIVGELSTFGTLIIGEERETPFVDATDQNHPRVGCTVIGDR